MAKRVYTQKAVTIESQIDTAIAVVNQNISFLRQYIEAVEALSEIENPDAATIRDLESAKQSVAIFETNVANAKSALVAVQAQSPSYVSSNTVWSV